MKKITHIGVKLIETVKGTDPNYREPKWNDKLQLDFVIPLPKNLKKKQDSFKTFENYYRSKSIPSSDKSNSDNWLRIKCKLTKEEEETYNEQFESLVLRSGDIAGALMENETIKQRTKHITNPKYLEMFITNDYNWKTDDITRGYGKNNRLFSSNYGFRSENRYVPQVNVVVCFPREEPIYAPAVKREKGPIIFIDVDGVVNIFPGSFKGELVTVPVIGRGFEPKKINCAPHTIDAINKWAGQVDVYWQTYWNEKARTNLAPALGLQDFPVAPIFKHQMKKECLQEQGMWDRPIVWIDDEISEELRENATHLQQEKADLLIVDAYFEANKKKGWGEYTGLTPGAIGAVDEFIAKYQ
jgi:hypothetical protein